MDTTGVPTASPSQILPVKNRPGKYHINTGVKRGMDQFRKLLGGKHYIYSHNSTVGQAFGLFNFIA
jgi:hypothetical protein